LRNPRTIFILFILGVAAAIGWWLKEQLIPDTAPQSVTKRQSHDYSMKAFTLTGMNQLGQPHYQLTADSMIHYPEDDHSDLEKPFMILFSENSPPWHVNSEKGKVYEQGELVKLLGKVIIKRASSPTTEPITITTYNLTIYPDKEYAETDESVHMLSNATDLKSIGMKAFLKESKIRLLNEVKGVHLPAQN
jgi:lipopolysaccharide export system protein LptC